ncbi:MAG: L,D-transpeptidase family protein [Candidatus Marinimicrobia bacterium]|nr:L,D-transpeptidase family protein [Candidatus Neomarinimicrobiota bacterium]
MRYTNVKMKYSKIIISRRLLILMLLIQFPVPILADPLFSNVVNVSADSIGYVLVVDKTHQKMFMVKSNAPGALEVSKEYRVTTGRRNGDKEREGDLKTPEGIYYVNGRVPEGKLTPKYGPIAYTLDYPNFIDRLQNRRGSNIWIHGRNEAIKDFLTEGCVSLENGQILNLAKYVTINQTPVIILNDLSGYDVAGSDYQATIEHWTNFTDGWAQSWDSGAIAAYISYYAPAFRDESGRNPKQYETYKSSLEERYQWKTVSVDKVSVLVSDHETHLKFRQRYLSPTFYSEGQKQLILVPVGSGWKIVRETFKPTAPRLSTEELLGQFLQSWENAWEKMDIETYLAFYADDFVSGEYDLAGWRDYKTQVFQASKEVSVERSALKIETSEEQVWNVTFRQIYQADGYRDAGLKTMVIKGFPGNMKIVREEWIEEN